MLRWTGAAFATGGYWYRRNLIRVGNPLPGLGLGIGEPAPAASADALDGRLRDQPPAQRRRTAASGSAALLPGLRTGFGAAWPVILLIAVGATVLGVVTLRGRELVAPVVGLVALAAFVVTPGTVWAPQLIARPGVHFVTADLFAFNLRYMLPAVAIGLGDRAAGRAARRPEGPLIATAALGVALAATQLSPQSRHSWSPHHVLLVCAIGLAIVAGGVMVVLTAGRRCSRRCLDGRARSVCRVRRAARRDRLAGGPASYAGSTATRPSTSRRGPTAFPARASDTPASCSRIRSTDRICRTACR